MLKIRLESFLTIFFAACGILFFQCQIFQLSEDINNLRNEYYQKLNSNIKALDVSNNDDIIIIYNRVPKTGSTSFIGVAYDICKKNNFHVIHVNVSSNNHVLSLPNQYSIVKNITNWYNMKPAIYHGHFAYLDFSKYSSVKPMYINIIRKPLDRLVSYYYFLRYGDNFRPYLIRKKHGDTMTFDECVRNNQPDCDPNNMWLQIPFFCGHAVDCWKPGNKWALAEAKKNLINDYLLVGVTEDLTNFVAILESTVPRIFKGATDYFLSSNKSHLRQTVQKTPPSEVTIKKIQNSLVWQMENDLYEFALEQFNFVKKHTLNERSQKYMFEKIRPKTSN